MEENAKEKKKTSKCEKEIKEVLEKYGMKLVPEFVLIGKSINHYIRLAIINKNGD